MHMQRCVFAVGQLAAARICGAAICPGHGPAHILWHTASRPRWSKGGARPYLGFWEAFWGSSSSEPATQRLASSQSMALVSQGLFFCGTHCCHMHYTAFFTSFFFDMGISCYQKNSLCCRLVVQQTGVCGQHTVGSVSKGFEVPQTSRVCSSGCAPSVCIGPSRF